MKKVILVVAAMLAMNAHASNNSNGPTTNNNQTYNQPQGGQGGAGGNGLAIAGAASAAEAKANAAAMAAQQQGQQQGQAQGQQQSSSSTSGVKNSGNSASGVIGSGNSGGNKLEGNKTSTSVSIGGDNYEAAASGVFAAPIPTVATSCRLYMFGGGTTVSGAVSGSVPLGNDQTCLSGNNVNAMLRTNQIFPGTYGVKDIVTEQCKVEGMETADACKALKK